jgi:hypothetical protein
VPATRYGTVTTTNPVTVTLDGEDIAVTASPINLGQALGVGDRVACEFRDKSLVILGSPVNGARDLLMTNLRALLVGGGVRTATQSGVSWSQRFISLGAGRGPLVQGGYYNIDMPPDGTVIPVYGHSSQTSATVSGVVPLATWQVLWYDVPIGAPTANVDSSRFKITSYTTPFEVPPTWLPLVVRRGDPPVTTYAWADGRESAAWTPLSLVNGWVAYGNGYHLPEYKVENGLLFMHGMIKSGTSGTIATLPVGARPSAPDPFATVTSPNAFARIDIVAGGVITAQAYSNAWLSLGIPPVPVEA